MLFSCPEPWVDPTSPEGRHWADSQPLPAEAVLLPMRELATGRVGEAWAECFTWIHRPFGPVHTELLPEVWSGLSAGLDSDASVLTVDPTGAITALSLVAPDAWDGRTLIISETVRQDQPDGERLLRSVVAASLRVLGRRGVRRVELEGHANDPHSAALVRSLPQAATGWTCCGLTLRGLTTEKRPPASAPRSDTPLGPETRGRSSGGSNQRLTRRPSAGALVGG